MSGQNSLFVKRVFLWPALVAGAILCVPPLYAANAFLADARPYPHETGAQAEILLSQARRSVFGMERELPQHKPEEITYALNDKTVLMVFGVDTLEKSFGTHNRPNANTLWYFRPDGVLFLKSAPERVGRANWSIVDDRILQVMYKSNDPDGATRVSIRVYPLQGFFESILDSSDGDACGIVADGSGAIAYEAEKIVGSSLEQVCESVRARQTESGQPYPTMSGIAADIAAEQAFEGAPDYIRNRGVASADIVVALVEKTVFASLAAMEYERSGDTFIHRTKNRMEVIAHFREDGRFFLNAGPNRIIFGDWMIANDSVLLLRPKMPGQAGHLNVQTWIFPLSQFVRSIRDSKDGDYCEMEGKTTKAFVYSNGQFSSSRLSAACGRRRGG